MKPSDRQKFIDLMQGVYALYRADFSPQVVEIWWRALLPYDLSAVADALTRHAVNPDTGQFVPKPADVVKMLGGTTKDSALVAWAKVLHAVRHIGSWATVVFDDPIVHKVVEELGGWIWLCMQTDKEWPHIERRFCEHYRVYKARGEVPDHPRKLVGMTDLGNVPRGFPEMQPALVGDPWVCASVLEGKATPLTEAQRLLSKAVA